MGKRGKVVKSGLKLNVGRTRKFSKRESKMLLNEFSNTPSVDGITDKNMQKIIMSFQMLKQMIPYYILFKDNVEYDNMFRSLSRNPLFDITGNKYFSTGLISSKASKCDKCETSKDHILQRTKALKIIFDLLVKNPDMNVLEYIQFLKRYCSTVILTRDEHNLVNVVSKKYPQWSNRKIYNKLKIKIPGIGAYEKQMNLVRAFQHSY